MERGLWGWELGYRGGGGEKQREREREDLTWSCFFLFVLVLSVNTKEVINLCLRCFECMLLFHIAVVASRYTQAGVQGKVIRLLADKRAPVLGFAYCDCDGRLEQEWL